MAKPMINRDPKRTYHIFDDYDLSQAFYILGSRIFENEWDGHNEIVAKKDDRSPDSIKAKNIKIDDELNEIKEDIDVFKRNQKKETDPHKKQTIEGMIDSRFERRQQLYDDRADDGFLESLTKDHETYRRRMYVENILIDAIKSRKFGYWAINSLRIDNRVWDQVDGCSYSIEMSCIWWSEKVNSGYKRQFIRIRKPEFDLWVNKNYPRKNPTDENNTKEELANSWIVEQIKKKTEWRKYDYIDYMTSKIGLSHRKANTIWGNHAPSHMKLAGRPKSKRSK